MYWSSHNPGVNNGSPFITEERRSGVKREQAGYIRRHNRNAPFWAISMIVLGIAGLSTNWIDMGAFWKGYALDMTGPAWNYILFRGLFTQWTENRWRKFFTPARTYLIFILVCFSIEFAQYLDLYDATFDPWDLLAYVSLLTPVFLLDLWQNGANK